MDNRVGNVSTETRPLLDIQSGEASSRTSHAPKPTIVPDSKASLKDYQITIRGPNGSRRSVVSSESFPGVAAQGSSRAKLEPRVESVAKTVITNQVNCRIYHDFYAGSIYIFNDITWIVNGALKAANPTGYSAPSFLGLIKSFAILTGISNLFEAVRYIEEAKKTKSVWSGFEGGVRVVRSAGEIASGITGTAASLVSTFATSFNSAILANTALATTIGSAIMLTAIGIYAGLNSGKNFYLHAKLSACKNTQEKVHFLESFTQDTKNLQFLKSLVMKDFAEKVVDGLDTSEANLEALGKELKALETTILWNGFNNLGLSLVSIASAIISLVLDTATGGALTFGLTVAKPIVSAILMAFDIHQTIRGINKAGKYEAKYQEAMHTALIVVSALVSITLFILLNVSTCGGATLAIGITALVLPLMITLFQMMMAMIIDQRKSKTEDTNIGVALPVEAASTLNESIFGNRLLASQRRASA
jgi:hypothetical protein